MAGHSGRERILSLIREMYWIIKGRVAVHRVLNSCFDCKRRQQLPGSQKMSDLPLEGVKSGGPLFTLVGVDYFGPFYIKCGHSMEKRYRDNLQYELLMLETQTKKRKKCIKGPGGV